MARSAFLGAVLMLLGLIMVTGCASTTATEVPTQAATAVPAATPVATASLGEAPAQLFPDVVDVVLEDEGGGTWMVAVTISSPYDSPDRYADGWRVLAPDGEELGVRVLTHDHGGEQPFTRTLSGVSIPPGVTEVTVEARDQVSGWGGATMTVTVPSVG